jgi:hypothetical protein
MEAMQNKHLQSHNRRNEMVAVIGVWCQRTTADSIDNITPQRDRQRVWRKRGTQEGLIGSNKLSACTGTDEGAAGLRNDLLSDHENSESNV